MSMSTPWTTNQLLRLFRDNSIRTRTYAMLSGKSGKSPKEISPSQLRTLSAISGQRHKETWTWKRILKLRLSTLIALCLSATHRCTYIRIVEPIVRRFNQPTRRARFAPHELYVTLQINAISSDDESFSFVVKKFAAAPRGLYAREIVHPIRESPCASEILGEFYSFTVLQFYSFTVLPSFSDRGEQEMCGND